jgi:hypothetical protein
MFPVYLNLSICSEVIAHLVLISNLKISMLCCTCMCYCAGTYTFRRLVSRNGSDLLASECPKPGSHFCDTCTHMVIQGPTQFVAGCSFSSGPACSYFDCSLCPLGICKDEGVRLGLGRSNLVV